MRPSETTRARRLLSGGDALLSSIRASDHEGLDLLPAHLSYRNFDLLLDSMKKSRKRLRKALAAAAGEYDLVVLDAPPNITLLSENLFEAADLILVPVIPTPLSERTWQQLLGFFADRGLPREKLRPFFSMVQTRSRLHKQTMLRLRDAERFLEVAVPLSADIERMAGRRPGPAASSAPRCWKSWRRSANEPSGMRGTLERQERSWASRLSASGG